MPLRPSTAGSEAPTGCQACCGETRSNSRAVPVVAVMLLLVMRTSRRAPASGSGQLWAMTEDEARSVAHKASDSTQAELFRLFRIRLRCSNLFGLEVIRAVAEFAGHLNHAILHHMIAIVLRKTPQHRRHIVARAGTLRVQRRASEDPDAALMKQPIKQCLARHRRIDQL